MENDWPSLFSNSFFKTSSPTLTIQSNLSVAWGPWQTEQKYWPISYFILFYKSVRPHSLTRYLSRSLTYSLTHWPILVRLMHFSIRKGLRHSPTFYSHLSWYILKENLSISGKIWKFLISQNGFEECGSSRWWPFVTNVLGLHFWV